MTVKIRVQDYQSIEDAEIEVSGLTVITGANNTGKSAMLRAVYGAFTNARGTKYVRHGKDQCRVDVTFGDGRTVTWEKGEKVNRYTVDGKTLDKVGAGVPVELEALGVTPITASGRELWPQFAQQFTGQVFLLDQPGSVLAESIADVSRVGVLNEALRNAQSDKRSLSSELKVRLSDVVRYEAQENTYAGLDTVEELAQRAEGLRVEADELVRELGELRELQESVHAHAALVAFLSPARAAPLPEDGSEARTVLVELTALRGLAREMTEAVRSRTALASVAGVAVPDAAEGARAMKLSGALTLVSGIRDQIRPLQAVIDGGADIRAASAAALPEIEGVADQAKQAEVYRQLRTEADARDEAVASLRREITAVTEALDGSTHEVREILGDAGSCPICGHG